MIGYLPTLLFSGASSLMYFDEYQTHLTAFQSILDSMYRIMITLSSVGYCDVTPITAIGKFVAVTSAVLAVMEVALITSIVVSSCNAQMENVKLFLKTKCDKLLDGILDKFEKEYIETLRKQCGMSKCRADALVK